MTTFLSDQWIEALDARLRADTSGSPTSRLVIQYDVTGGDGVVTYHLELGPTGGRAAPGPAADAHLTFTMDEATARAISDGELGTQEAFIMGRLDIEGDPAHLIEAHRSRDGA